MLKSDNYFMCCYFIRKKYDWPSPSVPVLISISLEFLSDRSVFELNNNKNFLKINLKKRGGVSLILLVDLLLPLC